MSLLYYKVCSDHIHIHYYIQRSKALSHFGDLLEAPIEKLIHNLSILTRIDSITFIYNLFRFLRNFN
jgi:hypothetical protein